MRNDGQLRIDLNDAVDQRVGTGGLNRDEIGASRTRLAQVTPILRARHAAGGLAFLGLPTDAAAREATLGLAKELRDEFDTLVVLGRAAGAQAITDALCHPYHNLLPAERRPGLRVFFADNCNPASWEALIGVVRLARTVFAITASDPESLAQLSFMKDWLQRQGGPDAVRRQIVACIESESDILGKLAAKEGWRTLRIPANVPGEHRALSAAGLLPAACAGIDVDALLAGAGDTAERCFGPKVSKDIDHMPAGVIAGVTHSMNTQRGRPINVLMPYADALRSTGRWFSQLCAENLSQRQGDVHVGATTLHAVGAADRPSLMPLLLDGPQDKFVIFLAVEKARRDVTVPAAFAEDPAIADLGGKTFSQLLDADRQAAAMALAQAGRPCVTILLPTLDAYHLGELLMTMEIATAVIRELASIDGAPAGAGPVERYKSALLQRPGSEETTAEIEAMPRRDPWLIVV